MSIAERSPHTPTHRLVPRRPLPPPANMVELPFEPEPEKKPVTIAERFEIFHERHPEVYVQIVQMARQAAANGYTRLSTKLCFEVLRWHHMVAVRADDDANEFRLNNIFTSHYSRLVMDQEPDLAGMFETRKLISR